MPQFILYLKTKLENIKELIVPSDYQFHVTLKNSSGDDQRDVIISKDELFDIPNSRGKANFIMKWEKDSKSYVTINMDHLKNITRNINEDDDDTFVPIIAFDCRGAVPIGFNPGQGFIVISKGGCEFNNVDLTDGDWAEFDESDGACLSIFELESKFESHRM